MLEVLAAEGCRGLDLDAGDAAVVVMSAESESRNFGALVICLTRLVCQAGTRLTRKTCSSKFHNLTSYWALNAHLPVDLCQQARLHGQAPISSIR